MKTNPKSLMTVMTMTVMTTLMESITLPYRRITLPY